MAFLIQVLLDTRFFTVSSAALDLNSCGLYRRTAVAGSPSRPALPNICAQHSIKQKQLHAGFTVAVSWVYLKQLNNAIRKTKMDYQSDVLDVNALQQVIMVIQCELALAQLTVDYHSKANSGYDY